MAQYTALQVADTWIAAGGPESRAVEWVAISLGESSYETGVVSSAGAIGLWQIMPEHAAEYGYVVSDLYDPMVNARIAVALSGHGTNCAAWDSCYENINASGRFTYLGWPQPGSADYNNLAVVAVQLGKDKLGGQVPPPGALPIPEINAAAAQIDNTLNRVFPAITKILINYRMAANGLYRG